MFNKKVVVTVTEFSGSTDLDKNEKKSVMLQGVAGVMPNRNVLSGTVAERAGFEIGKTYLCQVRERGEDLVYGRQFTFIKLMEITNPVELMEVCQMVGEPDLEVIARPAGFDLVYKRKTNAVNSITTQRIKEGQFIPASGGTERLHKTAAEQIDGASLRGVDTKVIHLKQKDLEKALKEAEKEDEITSTRKTGE